MQTGIQSNFVVPLYPDDTLEDLQRGGFRMLQKKLGFRFGMDSVLLAAYAASFGEPPSKLSRIADLGAGCGAISLLLAARLPGIELAGLELDPVSYETLERNIALNQLGDRFQAVLGDIRDLAAGNLIDPRLPSHAFDMVVSNPPYRRPGHTCRRESFPADPAKLQAMEETALSLDDLFLAASRLLKSKGRLVMVHRIFRLPDIMVALRRHQLEPKTLRLIQALPGKAPTTFLMSAVYQGRPGGFVAEPPLLVCEKPGQMSPTAADWYGLEPLLNHDDLYRGLFRIGALPE